MPTVPGLSPLIHSLNLQGCEGRVCTDMERWAEIRRRVFTGEMSQRAACREYEIHWETLENILTQTQPSENRRFRMPSGSRGVRSSGPGGTLKPCFN